MQIFGNYNDSAVSHWPDNKGELTGLGMQEVSLQRSLAPGVHAADSHLDQIGMDISAAKGALALMGLLPEFQRMLSMPR